MKASWCTDSPKLSVSRRQVGEERQMKLLAYERSSTIEEAMGQSLATTTVDS